MLDPWIIEEILRREEDRRREDDHGRVIPLESPQYHEREPVKPHPGSQDDDPARGVMIIDI
jgi:hypothetical protein